MRLAFVLGTRPEIIKTAPLLFEAQKNGVDFVLIHSGQHYDREMDGRFFEELGLPKPDIQLQSGGKPYAEQVGYLIREIGTALQSCRPDAVIVQGDTVTVMCAALAAQRAGVPIVHHEAGLRSRDMRMSEEYHRIVTDHIADMLCAPTEDARANLRAEGVADANVNMTGNTIVDAVRRFAGLASGRSDVLTRLGLSPKGYFILTMHRAENVDDETRFVLAMESIARVAAEHPDRPIVFPVHPRVERRRQEFGAAWPNGVRAIAPVGYLDMLQLVGNAELVMTDSGGLQEEASILGVPCVTLRDSTERPETVTAGMNVVAGLQPESVAAAVSAMRGKTFAATDLYGDGFAAGRIITLVIERFAA